MSDASSYYGEPSPEYEDEAMTESPKVPGELSEDDWDREAAPQDFEPEAEMLNYSGPDDMPRYAEAAAVLEALGGGDSPDPEENRPGSADQTERALESTLRAPVARGASTGPAMTPHEALEIALEALGLMVGLTSVYPDRQAKVKEAAAVLEAWEKETTAYVDNLQVANTKLVEIGAQVIQERDALQKRIEEDREYLEAADHLAEQYIERIAGRSDTVWWARFIDAYNKRAKP